MIAEPIYLDFILIDVTDASEVERFVNKVTEYYRGTRNFSVHVEDCSIKQPELYSNLIEIAVQLRIDYNPTLEEKTATFLVKQRLSYFLEDFPFIIRY